MAGIVGIDVGGTFTDLFFSGPDGISVLKVPSTPDDPSRGLIDAIDAAGLTAADLDVILHGTTIATNAVIERRGARCALVTTKGFRDVLELGRRDRRAMYGLTGTQDPLIPRRMRWEISERTNHHGEVITPLNDDEVRALARALKGEGLEAVVISFLHSYTYPEHEITAKRIFLEESADWQVITSHEVVREYYEFERTSTATVQGYLQPLVSRYSKNLSAKLAQKNFDRQTLVMQSNGGLVPLRQLSAKAANMVRSGPAAGVMAAARIAGEAGFNSVITGDMGGTSYDVAVVVDGVPQIADMTELDFRIPLRLPMIDVHTIGAGGGSIAYLDRGGILQVGPRSAGAVPGPICFGRGGTEPTVTDCNAVLGRINADHPIGLKHLSRLDIEPASKALARLGEPLGLGVEETAEAVLTLVNHVMARRTRLLTIERGLDPRDFALVIFGGAGPLHGAAVMREVGIRTMLLPPYPGVLCALGCAVADMRYDLSLTVERPLAEVDPTTLRSAFAEQRAAGLKQIADSGVDMASTVIRHAVNMSYVGQIHSLRVAVEADWSLERLREAFEETYRAENGSTLGDIPVALVGAMTTVEGIRHKPANQVAETEIKRPAEPTGHRNVHFRKWMRTPIYDRASFQPGMTLTGPAIIEQADTTTVIEPGMAAVVDRFSNVLVEVA
ncbi:N-methylhydantoinase A [Mesorhizobium australicum]|uniref:N-methylhydantoinase A n=2 Tax=Mesorhizobium australicum TaxID=536018 RepID=A0A1X7N1X3_9HYPH|nr:hydantoinase/oxoprolinase family protein [Mesorhizobium australicum]SMH30652.1 N-methylhydantoinase A [Mesorhizobium australicum]